MTLAFRAARAPLAALVCAIGVGCVVGGFRQGDAPAGGGDASPSADALGPLVDGAAPPGDALGEAEADSAAPPTDALGEAEASSPPPPADAGPSPTSCAPSARVVAGTGKDCGLSRDQDCCARPLIDGGQFLRSYDGVGLLDPSHAATVSAFRLDQFEITVGRFRVFVDAGMGTQAMPPLLGAGAVAGTPASGWSTDATTMLPPTTADLRTSLGAAACRDGRATWTDSAQGNEYLPIACATWALAFAFCIWDGGRLPTEAEWNFAASGGAQQRVYPWSDPPDSGAVSLDLAEYGCDTTNGCSPGTGILAVGSKPDGGGLFRHDDLAGNLAEWTLDTAPSPFDAGAFLDPCVDCVDTRSSPARAVRGGHFGSLDVADLRAGARGVLRADSLTRSVEVGFRCARPP